MSFRKDFIWGAATASYQIEGAAFEAGKGASVWDTFSHWDGKILHGDTGDIACDHYHRFRDDVKLMAQLGIKNYRFSLSWPRLLPDGTGRVNEEGVPSTISSSMLCLKTASAHSSRSFIGTILRLSKTAARGQIRTVLSGSKNMPRSAHAALETALRISSRSMSLSASSAWAMERARMLPAWFCPPA